MLQDKSIKKLLKILLVLLILFTGVRYTQTVYADNLCFYNYNTNSNVNYTGKQVVYTYNSREIPLTTPGIIIDGTALADYKELFVQELGLQAVVNENTITFTDGKTVLILTLGSKKVTVNNEQQTMSVAPVQLKFDETTIKYYVPTRFVAETFGYNYVWNSTTSIAKITKTLQFLINDKTVLYSGTFYAASYKEQKISLDMPMIYYNGHILAPAKKVFEAVGCTYEENSQNILLTNGTISINMELNSNIAYVNGIRFSMKTLPVLITEQATQKKQVYVPLEFVSEMLGYELSYDDSQRKYTLQDTTYTGKVELHPALISLLPKTEVISVEPTPIAHYYEWSGQENNTKLSNQKYLTKVVAYAVEDADVLELYGITREDINDFIDSSALIFELKSVLSDIGTQFYLDFSTPHLNYTLLTTINNNTKLLFMIPVEDTWYFVEKEDCVQVYFTNADLALEDLYITSEQTPVITEIPLEEPVSYPEDKLIIPLPESLNSTQVQDKDNYLEHNFQIIIPGHQLAFYEQNPVINPYPLVDEITIAYDINSNSTIITCQTKSICGYRYDFAKDYLAVTVAEPSEIYNKIVVLDAGHGGKDPGAVRDDVREKDLNFSILYNHAKELFEASDIKVYYTRETDVFISLNDRAKFASQVGADLFISLHINASEYESACGTEVFYSKKNNTTLDSGLSSYQLAKTLANNITSSLGSRLRGVTKYDYYVIEYNSVPAVLIELGFISNTEERSKLINASYQHKAAEAIYQSVIEIFSTYPTGR